MHTHPAGNNETDTHTQRRVVIAGGTGSIGADIVAAYIRQDFHVIVLTRNNNSASELISYLKSQGINEIPTVIAADYTSFAGAEHIAKTISAEYGPVTDVVASIGGWWSGPALWDITAEQWQQYFVGLTTAHVAMLRAFLPIIPKTGAYHLILGGSSYKPVPGSSLINMEQAALVMMRQVVDLKLAGERRLFALVLGPVINRRRTHGMPNWVNAKEVGTITTTLSQAANMPGAEYEVRTNEDVKNILRAIEETHRP